MANSIINSDNGAVSGSAGLKFTSGNDGVLQIQNNGNTAVSIDSAGVPTFAQSIVNPVPLFRAFQNADQTGVASSTVSKVNINDVVFDTHWDGTNNSSVGFNKTNFRYIAPIAGYYQFDAVIRCNGTTMSTAAAYFYKNGVIEYTGNVVRGVAVLQPMASTIINLSAGDYVEVYGYIVVASGGSFDYASDVSTSIFSGFLVRAT